MRYLLPLVALIVCLLPGCPEAHPASVLPTPVVSYCDGWASPPLVFFGCMEHRTEAECCAIMSPVEDRAQVCTEWHYDPEYPDFTYCLTWADTGV
jgi:hypothetical protein